MKYTIYITDSPALDCLQDPEYNTITIPGVDPDDVEPICTIVQRYGGRNLYVWMSMD